MNQHRHKDPFHHTRQDKPMKPRCCSHKPRPSMFLVAISELRYMVSENWSTSLLCTRANPISELLPSVPRLTKNGEGAFLTVPCQEVTAVSCKAVHGLIKGVDEVTPKEAASSHRQPAKSPFSAQGPWRERPQVSTREPSTQTSLAS
jgi:hypothetical protein